MRFSDRCRFAFCAYRNEHFAPNVLRGGHHIIHAGKRSTNRNHGYRMRRFAESDPSCRQSGSLGLPNPGQQPIEVVLGCRWRGRAASIALLKHGARAETHLGRNPAAVSDCAPHVVLTLSFGWQPTAQLGHCDPRPRRRVSSNAVASAVTSSSARSSCASGRLGTTPALKTPM